MIKRTIACLILAACLLNIAATAQSKLSVDNVYKAYLNNSGPIISDEEVKGYYLFYQTDKVDRKTNEYALQILDANLNKVKDISFTDSKHIQLQEAAFNGTDLLFSFFDSDNKLLDYRSYGIDGKQKNSYQRELDKKTIAYMKSGKQLDNTDEAQNNTLFSVDKKGFIALIPVRDDRDYSYEVNYYGTDKKSQWTYAPDDGAKYSMASYLGSSDSVAFIQVLRRESMFSSKVHTILLGLYLNNGRKAFEMETIKDQYTFYPVNIGAGQSASDVLLLGAYYNAGDNVLKDNTLGVGVWIISNQGKISKTQYNSWETDLSKFLPVNSKGKVDDLGYIYFHKILQTSDGKIFAVGEGYKKVVSAVGIGLKVLSARNGGSAASAFKLRITNMAIMQFNKDFKIEQATIYEKFDNIMHLPSGSEFLGPQGWAACARQFGAFDYRYTQTDKEHTTFVAGYTDYEKTSDYKGGTFHTITYYNNKFSTDKINLKSGASDIQVLPSKTGSVVVLEYYKKDKKLEMRIEKTN